MRQNMKTLFSFAILIQSQKNQQFGISVEPIAVNIYLKIIIALRIP